ncbi:efflux RND transporter periplasmic adaptor subunit [candidate division GN15 bacterium]|nr:efflux RND transporter periplasmic adaptor subunit [candidate division GN15 bacterium]
MRALALIIAGLAIGFGAAYLLLPADSPGPVAAATAESGQQYTCGMHPEIVSDEPGICPICNMKLTPKREAGEGAVRVDPATRQNMGLVTMPATYRTVTRSVQAFGKVAVPDPNVSAITLKFEGWIERLFVNEEGEEVFKGQPLAEVYSPALVAAQREYLVAHRKAENHDGMSRLLRMAEERLRNWDIPADQIERLRETGEVSRTMMVRAPASGIVLSKNVNTGDRVSPMAVLFELADLSTVWVEAFVYEEELPFVERGLTGTISTPSAPGERFESEVTFVSPVLDNKRQAEIRLVLANPNLMLKPEMYAEVILARAVPDERLVVPRKAVINSGERQMVFVASGEDTYQPRVVSTGVVGSDDMVEIQSGLNDGEDVVVSGQFLLDSETRLNEVLAQGGGHQHDHGGGGAQEHADTERAAMSETATVDDPYDIHTCPMPSHFHVLNYGPGTCEECGMDLVHVSEKGNEPVYVCPMPQCGVVQKDSGVCPVCNMHLIEYEYEDKETAETESKRAKDDPYDIHTCPMPSHFHVLNYGPGTCEECGMDLVHVSGTENRPVYVCPMPECGVAQTEPGVCPVCNMHLTEYPAESSDD